MGIEPTTRAWEALILPLNYTRTLLTTIFNITDFVQLVNTTNLALLTKFTRYEIGCTKILGVC
jgi:hypothetical protein